jgi:FkbM family methyltransferase
MSRAHLRGSDEYPPFAEVSITPAARRAALLRGIGVILDVGANTGQYAKWARSFGYRGRIISFEPTTDPFTQLSEAARSDQRWECHRVALGPSDAEIDLHLSRDTICTSAFETTPEHLTWWPGAAQSGVERVPMRSLASIWPDLRCDQERVYLKIDVEGFELAVLDGAAAVLDRISYVELEIAIVPHYRNSPLLHDVLPYMTARGFSVVSIEQNLGDDYATGQMLMVEGIFRGPREPDWRPQPIG